MYQETTTVLHVGGGMGEFISRTLSPFSRAAGIAINTLAKHRRQKLWVANTKYVSRRNDCTALEFSRIDFSENIQIGIPAVDSHHKLVAMCFNRIVSEASSVGAGISTESGIVPSLSRLVTLISEGFDIEEIIMREYSYNRADEHAERHSLFLCELIVMLDGVNDCTFDFESMIYFIGAWFSGHSLIADKMFGVFCEAQVQGPSYAI